MISLFYKPHSDVLHLVLVYLINEYWLLGPETFACCAYVTFMICIYLQYVDFDLIGAFLKAGIEHFTFDADFDHGAGPGRMSRMEDEKFEKFMKVSPFFL